MKALLILAILCTTSFAHAQVKTVWKGDILCAKPYNGTELVADAKGRIEVTKDGEMGIPQANVKLEVRLFSGGGSVKGSTFNKLDLNGEVTDGNDYWSVTLIDRGLNRQEKKIIKDITLDLSTHDKGLSKVITLKGNEYVMDCLVRED